MPIRILCYNIHGGYDRDGRRDLKRLHRLMEDYAIDIGVFQEIETRPSRGGTIEDINTIAGIERPHRLPALTLSEEGGWYGNLIVSRFPILRAVVHDLETTPFLEPRNAADALIETPAFLLRLIGTHLSLSPWERWSEVRNLVRLIDAVEDTEKNPLLLMGDLNEWRPTSRLLKHLNSILTPAPCGATFPSFLPIFKLDRVWSDNLSSPISVDRLKTAHTQKLSDHLPLIIELG